MKNNRDAPIWQVIGAGVVALAVAMGIGRFAFTPLLPLMLRDGALEGGSGATWAAANYAGYLLGALTVPLVASRPDKGLRPALVGIAATTLAVPLAVGWTGLGPLLRGASGVFSAWVLVGVPATFLPAMARRQVDDPLIFGLTWPLFGLAAALSVAAAARWLSGRPRRRVWALAQTAMAIGTALPILTQSIWSLATSAVFVGGSFMISTMAGLQLARELDPDDPAPLQAAMTVAFAVGQILGPLLVQALGTGLSGADPLSVSHACATIVLAVTAAWLWAGSRAPSIFKEETR
jgi:hypothetical protein